MEKIDNYKISSSKVNGNMTLYTDNFKDTKSKVGTFGVTVMESFKQSISKFGTVQIYNKELTKKVLALTLIGAISISSFTGCALKQNDSKDKNNSIIAQDDSTETVKYTVKNGDTLWAIASMYYDNDAEISSETIKIADDNHLPSSNYIKPGMELSLSVPKNKIDVFKIPTKAIEYEVKLGDNLWNIAGKYCDNDGDIADEVTRIKIDNSIDSRDILSEGTILKLNVPYDKLSEFGIVLDKNEMPGYDANFDVFPEDSEYKHYEEEWKSRVKGIEKLWQTTKDSGKVSPDNMMFQRDYKEIFGHDDGTAGLLISVYSNMESLREMISYGIYSDEAIYKKVCKIDDLIRTIDDLTEINFLGLYDNIGESGGMKMR